MTNVQNFGLGLSPKLTRTEPNLNLKTKTYSSDSAQNLLGPDSDLKLPELETGHGGSESGRRRPHDMLGG